MQIDTATAPAEEQKDKEMTDEEKKKKEEEEKKAKEVPEPNFLDLNNPSRVLKA